MITAAAEDHPILSIQGLCQLLGVSRSWYYDRLGQPAMVPAEELALRDAIEELVLEVPGYDYRRVSHALVRAGWTVNHKRVLRVMREASLLCQLKRRFVATTDSQHGFRRYPNLIKDLVIDRLDYVWVADIIYIRLPTAFFYLAAILDALSRRCVGWELSKWIYTDLTLAALDQALWMRRPQPGLIHHSDQGVQPVPSVTGLAPIVSLLWEPDRLLEKRARPTVCSARNRGGRGTAGCPSAGRRAGKTEQREGESRCLGRGPHWLAPRAVPVRVS